MMSESNNSKQQSKLKETQFFDCIFCADCNEAVHELRENNIK